MCLDSILLLFLFSAATSCTAPFANSTPKAEGNVDESIDSLIEDIVHRVHSEQLLNMKWKFRGSVEALDIPHDYYSTSVETRDTFEFPGDNKDRVRIKVFNADSMYIYYEYNDQVLTGVVKVISDSLVRSHVIDPLTGEGVFSYVRWRRYEPMGDFDMVRL